MAEFLKHKLKGKKKNKLIQYQEIDHETFDDEESKNEQQLTEQNNHQSGNGKFETYSLEEQKAENNAKIQVCSEAWPDAQDIEIKTHIHSIIRERVNEINPKNIYFRQLTHADLIEVKNLHNEWFPLDYSDRFFERIFKSNVIAIGCFIKLKSESNPDELEEIILGTIMTKIKDQDEEVIELYNAKNFQANTYRNWFQSFFCREYQAAYIMTIGIVDECRRLGLGSKMLKETIAILNSIWPNCEILYLHVVDYNESAIRFYEKNGFIMNHRIKNHYEIFEKRYDALVLYKDVSNQQETLNRLEIETTQQPSYIDKLRNYIGSSINKVRQAILR